MENNNEFIEIIADDKVIKNNFFISKFPISEFIFHSFCSQNMTLENNSQLKKTFCSWYDAKKFCNLVNKKIDIPSYYDENEYNFIEDVHNSNPNLGFRLPTAIEWEYAAKALWVVNASWYLDIQNKIFIIRGLNDWNIPDADFISKKGVAEYSKMEKNSLGIYGILGNSYEWYFDPYNPYNKPDNLCYWEEYITNYNNDYSFQIKTSAPAPSELFGFRMVTTNRDAINSFNKFLNQQLNENK